MSAMSPFSAVGLAAEECQDRTIRSIISQPDFHSEVPTDVKSEQLFPDCVIMGILSGRQTQCLIDVQLELF